MPFYRKVIRARMNRTGESYQQALQAITDQCPPGSNIKVYLPREIADRELAAEREEMARIRQTLGLGDDKGGCDGDGKE